MGTRTADCRKFSPNIFNKSKCSHCFRHREEHSAAALECNRASRKVSKCGYLFVAPDWDFNNPLYRTKRWQRRWFVLYDDGQLTYSVDEHPETVPQAVIDMTKVIEVTTAEDVTGHSSSIAITAPDRVTFVKGTCPEESKWWLNILVAYPKSKGRHKRNATFPGGQTTTKLQQTSANPGCGLVARNRHNSYHKDVLTGVPNPASVDCWDLTNSSNGSNDRNIMDNVSGLDDPINNGPGDCHQQSSGGQDENNKNAGNEITNRVYTDQPVSSKSPPTRDKIHPETKAQVRIRNRNRTAPSSVHTQQDDYESVSPCLLIENVRREEKLKHIANTITNLSQSSNRWSTSSVNTNKVTTTLNNALNSQSQGLNDERPTRDETDFPISRQQQTTIVNLRPKSLPLASNSTPAIVSAIVKKIPPVVDQKCDNNNKSSPKLQQQLRILQQRQQTQPRSHERGDPDGGCNLDDLSTNYLAKTSELRVNLPAEEILHSKKGWLMKQDSRTGDWTKHWFVLSGAALFYYRDAVSEERGVLDGVLDVNSLTSVCEVNTSRNNAFQMVTWDKRRLVLSALSANSRNSWITMLRNAAGIKSEPEVDGDCIPTTELIIEDSTLDENKNDIENEFIKAQKAQQLVLTNNNKNSAKISQDTNVVTPQKAATTPITPVTPKNTMFSSDEEYRTASEGGRRDSVDWGSPVSPSSPLPTALFRARERIKSRPSCPRMHKRSRSSPPNSRRNTVDSIGSDELPVIHSVQEEFHVDKELQFRLNVAERERDILRDEAKEREARMSELLTTLERTEQELNARIREMEEARDNLSSQLDEAKRNAEKIVDRLTVELEESQTKIKDLEDRLSLGIEENEGLYKKLREIESCSPSSFSNLNRHKLKRMDSLSDLTQISDIDPYCLDRDMLADEYSELRSRFEKAVCEIKAMKRELKESQNQFDNLEITYASLRQDLERQRIEDHSQLQMMAERIQDLTLKYSGSERQVRTLKQKLAKSERRRSLSLKGKEQLTVSKELENKVTELESKIDELEKKSPSATKVVTSPLGRKSVRRRSLESSASTDSLHVMMHVNELEKRIEGVVSPASEVSSAPSIDIQRSSSSPKISEHLIDRLKCLEGVLICSKERLEYCLHQLHTRKSPSRSRRSVSPNVDRKDQYKFIEQCIGEVLQMIKESCETCVNKKLPTSQFVLLPDTHPIKNALVQLESQLRAKLADLLKQRRMLRERNELTPSKDLELLAERIAFESVCFGRLQESMVRAENPEAFHQMLTCSEIAETSHLISTLKAKISGKCIFKPSGSLDILAGVLARRLVLSSTRKERSRPSDTRSLEPKLLDELLRQQNEVNLIAKRYKNNTMENLAAGLAAETLSYMASNDLVQGAIQEAWRQAQEIVNAELVQTEIAHIMTKNAKRLEDAITPSFGYALTTEERLTFESFADAVQESMRKEMDTAIEQLSQCYQEALQKMKRGQWRMSFEQDRNSSEGRQLLAEFADVIAHKALIDARIAILQGDFNTSRSTNPPTTATATKANLSSVSTLRKYENLFEELTTDLQISNADDILVEADFEFMYKNRTIDFLNDPATIKEVANFLSQLERSIEELRCTLQPNLRPKLVSKEIHTLQDVCQKCFELHTRALSLAKDVQHMTVTCSNCSQLQNTICNLQVDHESKVSQLQKDHDNDMSILLHRVESHRNTIEGLERERDALAKEIHQQRNLVENRGRELTTITMKLKSKEEECHRKEKDNLDLMDRLEDRNEQIRNHQLEKDNLEKKCSRQDDQYAVLLQERDFIQAELNKERELGRRMERRLEMLENEHSKQLECLQEAYRDQILSHCSDFTNIADEESFRQRYQTEIEQLRTLCEKGLSAMESSHRRIIHDLEEKHRKEIDRLLVEKETALAEETQATLAALDAMRKAHQSEVQREVARFKQEFIRQFQKGEHPVDSTKIKEEELEELRQEILSFSEKYSIKCVENAALEEKLRSANQKLKHFQQMQQLELRNKQFRAHLASENPSTDINFVQGLTSKEEITSADSEV